MPKRVELSDGFFIYVNSAMRAGQYVPLIEAIRLDLARQLDALEIQKDFYFNVLLDVTLWSNLAREFDKLLLLGKDIAQLPPKFLSNLVKAISRSYVHADEMQQHFATDKPLHLAKITDTHSDDHKGGQHVLLLHFSDDNHDETYTIVYKPRGVDVDDFVIGQHDQEDKQEPESSITELLNAHLHRLKRPQLPTCRFIRGNATIKDGYGFAEFLPHRPWPMIDPTFECYRLIQEFSKRQHSHEEMNVFLQAELRTAYKKLYESYPYYKQLIDAVKDLSSYLAVQFECELMDMHRYNQKWGRASDFVIDDERRYSFERGCTLAMVDILRIADLHMENAIVCGQHFMLSDLECICQPTCNSLDDSLILRGTGGMGYDPTSISFWVDADDEAWPKKEFIQILRPLPNRAFVLQGNDSNGMRLVPCKIDEPAFLDGFSCVWNIVRENQHEFLTALAKHQTLPIRIVPYETALWSTFRVDAMRQARQQEDQKSWLASSTQVPKYRVLDLPSTVQALRRGDIPIFYCQLTDRCLRDERGVSVINFFHSQTPFECVAARITTLGPIPSVQEKALRQRIAELNQQSATASDLLSRLKPHSPPHSVGSDMDRAFATPSDNAVGVVEEKNDSPLPGPEDEHEVVFHGLADTQHTGASAEEQPTATGAVSPVEDWDAELAAEAEASKNAAAQGNTAPRSPRR